MADNKRLTYKNNDGTFGVKGTQLPEDPKLYMCIVKLKDYEDLNVTPDEVERLIQFKEDYDKSRPYCCDKCHKGVFSHEKFCWNCGSRLKGMNKDAKQ